MISRVPNPTNSPIRDMSVTPSNPAIIYCLTDVYKGVVIDFERDGNYGKTAPPSNGKNQPKNDGGLAPIYSKAGFAN